MRRAPPSALRFDTREADCDVRLAKVEVLELPAAKRELHRWMDARSIVNSVNGVYSNVLVVFNIGRDIQTLSLGIYFVV